MHRRARPPRGGFGGAATVVAAFAVLLSVSEVAGALPSPHPAVAPRGNGAPAMPHALPFGARAGFLVSRGAAMPDAAAARGARSVDVVFQPTNLSHPGPVGPGPLPVGRFAARHGLSVSAYASAERYFEREGLTVLHEWPDRLVLSLAGPVPALDRAFGTDLESGTRLGRSVTFPATPPSLPPSLESEVAGVVGLTTGFDSFTLSLTGPAPAGAGAPAAPAGSAIMPGMARSMYNLSKLYNLSGGPSYPTAQSIALVLWGAGYAPSDLQAFYSQDYPSSFPLPTIDPYPLDGATPPSDSATSAGGTKAVEELTLDLEWSGSIAPGATLDAVYVPGPSTANLTDALDQALALPGVVTVSMSFGAAESADAALESAWNPLFQEAANRGITVLAATGDSGGDLNQSCSGGPAPEFPASSPLVVGVGGTAVTVIRTPLGTITGYHEDAWGDGGGGFSSSYAAPSWQLVGSAGVAVRSSGGGRGTPDVSATSVHDFLRYDGSDQEADGTSFATPLWAGLVADLDAHAGRSLGFFTDRLYYVANRTYGQADDGFTDVVTGGNCIAAAASGWDAATGWGSPRAQILYESLAGSFVNLTLQESPTTVGPGGSLTATVTAANWSTGAALAGTPVTLRVAGGTSVGPCTGTFETITAVTDLGGSTSAALSVPACYLGAHAVVTASIETDRLYGHASVRVAVNLLGFFPALEPLGVAPYSYLLYASIMAVAVALGGWIGRRRPSVPGGPSYPVVPPGATLSPRPTVAAPPPRPTAPPTAPPAPPRSPPAPPPG